jgi:hypothetical protein
MCRRCLDKPVTTHNFTHVPSHPMVRTSRFLHYRDRWKFFPSAKAAVERVKVLIRESETGNGSGESSDSSQTVTKRCVGCNDPVSLPCWFCVTCGTYLYGKQYSMAHCPFLNLIEDDTFVCDACDLKDAPCFNKASQHRSDHPLIRYKLGIVEETTTVESKLVALEANFGNLEKRIVEAIEKRFLDHQGAMEKRFIDHQKTIAGRLSALEELIRSIAGRQ